MYLTAFPRWEEYKKMKDCLDALGLPYETISPDPAYGLVGCPAIIIDQAERSRLSASGRASWISSGWIEYRPVKTVIPDRTPPSFHDDLFGVASIMMLAPCLADDRKVRLIAHISGQMADAFPYLNAVTAAANYHEGGQTLTFMEGYRLITLYPQKVAIAKADDLVDGWHLLESIRCRINQTYAKRDVIEPLYVQRQKPPAMEIYKRLPGTNCRQCGHKTCLAFALALWNGAATLFACKPVIVGDYVHMQDRLREICAGLGTVADADLTTSAYQKPFH
jgi:ArsR family metal-binding transcriptional regulator